MSVHRNAPAQRDVEVVLWERARRRGPRPTLSAAQSFTAPAARVLRVVRTGLRMRSADVAAHHHVAAENGWTWSYDRTPARSGACGPAA